MKVELKKATKKILAVGSAAILASSTVAAAGLNNYPQNFVDNGEFDGQVVVGASGVADDSAAAAAVIADLQSEFSGNTDKVQINYRAASEEGTSFNLVESPANQINYGEMLSSEADVIDEDSDVSMFEVKKFDNQEDDVNFEQQLEFVNGHFNFGLRDSLDNEDEEMEDAAAHFYYDKGQSYAQYTIEFDDDVNSTQEDDFIGETLSILCNDYIISGVSTSNSLITEIELLGGANKVALGEGEEAEVSFEGQTYNLKVLTVDTEGSNVGEVVISVNGITKAVKEFSNEEIGGVTVAVTEVVDSDREAAKGYAEIVFGGGKITLKDDKEVEVNEEKVSDETDDMYVVEANLNADSHTGFGKFVIDFKVNQDTVIMPGESLVDPVFGCFALNYNGLEEGSYSTIEMTAGEDQDEISVTGDLASGDSFNDFVIYLNGTTSYLKGSDDDTRVFHRDSGSVGHASDAYLTGSDFTMIFNETVQDGYGLFMYESSDEQYMYRINSIDTSDVEIDFEEVIEGKEELAIKPTEVNSKLEVKNFVTSTTANTSVIDLSFQNTVNSLLVDAFKPELHWDNERVMNFSDVEANTNMTVNPGNLYFTLDDVSGDSDADEQETIRVQFGAEYVSNEVNSRVSLNTASSSLSNNGVSGLKNDISDSNDDEKVYVTSYGTMITTDSSDDDYSVMIKTPSKQTYANVDVTFGNNVGSSSEVSIIVDADQVEDKKADLEAEGFEVVGTVNVASDAVEFDVTAPVIDSAASGSDMIVVGGPAVNSVARSLLGISEYSMDQAGVSEGQYVIRYFESKNSVLVYGYSKADTMSAVEKLNAGGLSGTEVRN